MNFGKISLRLHKRSLLLHPLVVFSGVWLSVVSLYALHLSRLLLYPSNEVVTVAAFIWIPFFAVAAVYTSFHRITELAYPSKPKAMHVDVNLLERRLTVWFRVWVVISVFEIVVSGGIPLIWLIRGNPKTYMDFGIHSLHGLVNSLLVSIAICRLALFLITGARKHLRIPVFVVFWSLIVVTRQLMMVSLLEYVVIVLLIKPIRLRTVSRILVGLIIIVLVFGFLGDMRSGSEQFRSLAEPTESYPDWLPSGFLWAYIYISTPINNLIFTMHTVSPENNPLFPNTTAALFPSVLREIVYGNRLSMATSGNLVTEAFNVSTAYIGPFQDYGLSGIVLFSILIAFACMFFWYRSSLSDLLIFSVLVQCLVFTLFFDLFFALPVITQVVWVSYFFMPKIRFGKAPSQLFDLSLRKLLRS